MRYMKPTFTQCVQSFIKHKFVINIIKLISKLKIDKSLCTVKLLNYFVHFKYSL